MKKRLLSVLICLALTAGSVFGQYWYPVTSGAHGTDGTTGGQIYCLLTYDSVLYAAGSFTKCNGTTGTACNHIAQWNGTTWSTVGTSGKDGVNGTIYAMCIFNGKLVVAGSFTTCNGTTATACNRIAQWNGTVWSVCGAAGGKDGVKNGGPTIYALAEFNSKLVAAGYFGTCNGNTTACNNVAQWDGTTGGTSWSVCGGGGGNDGVESGDWPVACLTVVSSGTVLVAGGAFNSCNGGLDNCTNIAQWNGTSTNTSWSVCGEAYPGDGINYTGTTILAFCTYGNHLVVGGTFHGKVCNNSKTECDYVAQWDGTSSTTSWSPLLTGPPDGVGPTTSAATQVNSLNVSSGCLFIGGQFTDAGSTITNANNVIYWNGSAFQCLGPSAGHYGTSTTVYASTIYSGYLYAGGTITTADNADSTVHEIARFKGSVLPVDLTSFNAVYDTGLKNVLVTWSTATEVNNKYFTVEKSTDGDTWETVTTYPSKAIDGNSSTPLYYNIADNNPFIGISYYRLLQTDFDGNTRVYDPVPVNVPANNTLSVYPNPAINNLTVDFKSTNACTLNLSLISIVGQVISTMPENAQKGLNVYNIDVNTLPKGVYLLRMETSDNQVVYSKFIKG